MFGFLYFTNPDISSSLTPWASPGEIWAKEIFQLESWIQFRDLIPPINEYKNVMIGAGVLLALESVVTLKLASEYKGREKPNQQ
jgi:hypothetical protein